ncbi:MAG: hypothetical protein A3I61_06600 [Acidobacteria bacterium RIFCSPLOWO2_02_FULL_68_18]|nr:MAG: hypothetical protein A3I61_06600 [Acidobacteria bacterium RIFCSPLOWO2_02_FULL_68_18]OFW50323.1 MAG: hypothetical protein A3G77_07595 [Acidobacteria bacterium RIFCSPLOWO2_12_FULL_68_19]
MKIAICSALLIAALGFASAAAPASRAVTYGEVAAVLDVLRADLLPPDLRTLSPADREAAWPGWVTRRDMEIRRRLERGDEDSVVTLLLFGVTFTKQPRYSFAAWAGGKAPPGRAEEIVAADPVVQMRARDLAAAMAAPSGNERLQFARGVIERNGLTLATAEGRQEAERFLLDALRRMLAEYEEFFRERPAGATLFRQRGLASDTSIHAAFAIERALEDLAARKYLTRGQVRRVAVVGPGLDFADKQEGLDVYPIQTIQPFAVIDSLRRLDLADPQVLRVAAYDLSPRVNRHLDAVVQAARAGRTYTLHFPRNEAQPWTPEFVSYWERIGAWIGESTAPVPPIPALPAVRMRAVRLRPDVVQAVAAEDLNVVLQRPDLTSEERFDLVIATNILIYYDVFEQSLALGNIAAILRPGGLLLTNTPLFELPAVPMRLAGETPVVYMDGGRDWIMWYERQ